MNVDKPGVGFNDPTPATPVGGNNAPTLGGQRLAAVQAAAEKWQSLLDTNVDVVINVTFASVAQPACTASGGVLAQAYPISWAHSFAGAPRENVWYPIALANKLAGTDLEPGRPDIFVQFNLDIDDSVCFGDTGFYYGLDGQHGSDVDLYVVALHEIAHGLGVASAERAPT
ncbi:MAG TPA: peptidase, partial [Thermoanaerobaculia bacterium]|nr:peptidase [Thermoanaerobaculia bacterium]